ncbi:EAL domain-containing protein [Photobacterium profundum]|nr:EAL domain-containing protein [Photobacterium profundum]
MCVSNKLRVKGVKKDDWFKKCRMEFLSLSLVVGLAFLFSLSASFFSRVQLSYVISSDSKDLLNTYMLRIDNYHPMMKGISDNFQFNCKALDDNKIQQVVYNDYFIRRITLTTNDGEQCTSFKGAGAESKLLPLIDQLSTNLSLWVTSELGDMENLLVVEWKDKRGSMLVHMEPLIFDILTNKYCDNCVLSSITSTDHPATSFWRGDASLLEIKPLMSSEFANNLRIDTFVKPELLAKYRDALWLPLFLLGGGVGILFIAIHRLFDRRRMSLHSMVEQGLVNKEFVPYYQPIVNVTSQSLYGCEMLARWKRPGQELISPMEFIPYVEKSGQILPITEQLIKKAIDEIGKLNWQNTKQIISINVVPEQLESIEIIDRSLDLLRFSKLEATQLAFEVTERKPFNNLTMAFDVIEYLRDKGIDVKLDDAGTGYGGFSYIQELNIRSLKIDKMFVENIGTSDIKLSLLDSIIAFGRQAGMEMIAEGVETKEQSEYLAEQGVYLQQGYYFGRPMVFRDFAYFCKGIASHLPLAEEEILRVG